MKIQGHTSNKFVKDVKIEAELSLTVGCRQNSPAEKEVIGGWILVDDLINNCNVM